MTPSLDTIFTGFGAATLDLEGLDGIPQAGEGSLTGVPGSDDDDDAYIEGFGSRMIDPESNVYDDPKRPLVFYQISIPIKRFLITKESTSRTLRFFF
jgi:hypothetical protein